jgi:hypothetical protein
MEEKVSMHLLLRLVCVSWRHEDRLASPVHFLPSGCWPKMGMSMSFLLIPVTFSDIAESLSMLDLETLKISWSQGGLQDEDGLVMKTLRVGASGVLSKFPIHQVSRAPDQ